MSPKQRKQPLLAADVAGLSEMPFTVQRIRDAERLVAEGEVDVDAYGRRSWRDAETPGLRLVVTRQGGAFYFVGRIDGRAQSRKIGDTRTIELHEAKATAGSLKYDGTAAARIAPRKAVAGGSDTLKQVWEAYVAEAEAGTFRVKRKIRPNTLRSYKGVWGASLSNHGSKSLVWVADHIDGIFLPLQATTPYAANRALALVSLLFRYAAQRRSWAGANPVAEALRKNRLARHEEKPRQRFLSDAERKRFRQACEEAPAPWGDLFAFAHETGLRKRALLGLQWKHVHAERRKGKFVGKASLVIPADIMKAGRSDHCVDLRPDAVAALERRYAARADEDDDGFVFAWEDGSQLNSSSYGREFHDICTAAQVKGLRPHDLRRDLGARLIAAGTPLPIVAKILGHSPASIAMLARTYAPVSDSTARQWLLDAPAIPKAKRARAKAPAKS
jgi:integrase